MRRRKFWRRGSSGNDNWVQFRRLGDDGLSIESRDGDDWAYIVLSHGAEALLQWLESELRPEPPKGENE